MDCDYEKEWYYYSVYSITCLENLKVYIGRAWNPEVRFKAHMNNLRGQKHSSKLMQSDFNKYGEETFKLKILEIVCTFSRMASNPNPEKEWMLKLKTYNPQFGYNSQDQYFRGKEYKKYRERRKEYESGNFNRNAEKSD